MDAHQYLRELCGGRDTTSSELYLDPVGSEMQYYFIDKANCHPFWAQKVSTWDLGISSFETPWDLSKDIFCML